MTPRFPHPRSAFPMVRRPLLTCVLWVMTVRREFISNLLEITFCSPSFGDSACALFKIQNVKVKFSNEDRKGFIDAGRAILRLPSIETQTVAWFKYDTAYGWRSHFGWRNTNFDLVRNGFNVYVRGMLHQCDDRELWTFTIAKVEVPEKFRGRGWFENYLELAWRAMPHDAMVVEQVINRRLFDYFCRQPYYLRSDRSFLRMAPRGIEFCPAWPSGKSTYSLPFSQYSRESP